MKCGSGTHTWAFEDKGDSIVIVLCRECHDIVGSSTFEDL